MEIYLIRHTRPAIDKTICYGQSDIDVDNSFVSVSDHINQYLPNDIDLVVTSPLKRCVQLARSIETYQTNLNPLIIDNGLMEMDFGDWEMQSWDSINENALSKWMKGFVEECTPNGESFTVMYKRVVNAFKQLPLHKHEKIAIVTHAGVIRCLLSLMSNINLADTFKFELDYAGITLVKFKHNQYSFKYINKVIK